MAAFTVHTKGARVQVRLFMAAFALAHRADKFLLYMAGEAVCRLVSAIQFIE